MFHAHLMAAVGGMLYRFDPTTLAFQPKPGAFYFPTPVELFISVGFVALAIAAFMFLVKVLAILPAPMRLWYSMEAARTSRERLAPNYSRRLIYEEAQGANLWQNESRLIRSHASKDIFASMSK